LASEYDQRKDFYALIGEITLTHAAIEQDLKNLLLHEWKISPKVKLPGKKEDKEVDIETLHGWKLGKTFLTLMSLCQLPQVFHEQYSNLFKEFEAISKERNETLKALYSFDKNEGHAFKMDMNYFHSPKKDLKMESIEDFQAHVNRWLQKADPQKLQDLKESLLNMRQKFLKLQCEVWSDKMKKFQSFFKGVGSTIPELAMSNPYLYVQELKDSCNPLAK